MTETVWLRAAALAVLCLAFHSPVGSCVQFDGQTVQVRVDAAHDRLDLQFVYRDLHSTGPVLRGALEQLETLRAGERWFAVLSNFPLMVHLESMLADPPAAGTPPAAVLAALERHLEVRPGELWVNAAGELCGSQLVRLRDLDGFVRKLDGLLRDVFVELKVPFALTTMGITDPESHALLVDALARGEPLLRRRGSSFVVRLPVTELGARQFLSEMLRGIVAQHGEELAAMPGPFESSKPGEAPPASGEPTSREMSAELASTLALLGANDWSVARRRGALEFSLGDPDAATWNLETPHAMGLPGAQRAELLPALREAGWDVLGPEHEAALAARWRAFLAED